MWTDHIPIDNLKRTEAFKPPNGTPIRRLTTPALKTDVGLFRVHFAIIGPEPEEKKDNFPLDWAQAEMHLQELANTIMLLKNHIR